MFFECILAWKLLNFPLYISVGFCVVINGFCYWATLDLAKFQKETRLKPGSKIIINFSISFFLITAAGAVSVIAAACNLLRRHGSSSHTSSSSSSATTRDPETDDCQHLLGDEFDPTDMSQSMSCLPPPPPYSPWPWLWARRGREIHELFIADLLLRYVFFIACDLCLRLYFIAFS